MIIDFLFCKRIHVVRDYLARCVGRLFIAVAWGVFVLFEVSKFVAVWIGMAFVAVCFATALVVSFTAGVALTAGLLVWALCRRIYLTAGIR